MTTNTAEVIDLSAWTTERLKMPRLPHKFAAMIDKVRPLFVGWLEADAAFENNTKMVAAAVREILLASRLISRLYGLQLFGYSFGIMKKPRNPVALMDSVDALDLLSVCLRLLRLGIRATPALLDRLREQRLRHQRALRHVITEEPV